MRWHGDPEVEKALIRLIDALCTFERNTFRGSTLIFVPDRVDNVEKAIFVKDGKPIPDDPWARMVILDSLRGRLEDGELN